MLCAIYSFSGSQYSTFVAAFAVVLLVILLLCALYFYITVPLAIDDPVYSRTAFSVQVFIPELSLRGLADVPRSDLERISGV